MLRGTGDDVLSCGHLETCQGAFKPRHTRDPLEICSGPFQILLAVAAFQVPLSVRHVYALLQLG